MSRRRNDNGKTPGSGLCIVLAIGSILLPRAGEAAYAASLDAGDLIQITAMKGHLLENDGGTAWSGPGTASVLVSERDNTGLVTGHIRVKGHMYTVLIDQFGGERPSLSGGIARDLPVKAVPRPNSPVRRQASARVGGWGGQCTVWRDGRILKDEYRCRFLVLESAADILELHVIVEAPTGRTRESSLHFMWDDVQWWDGSEGGMSGPGKHGWSDAEMQRLIERALDHHALIDENDIDVRVEAGRVTLAGTVESAVEKNRAYVAGWVQGVQSVRNQLDVRHDATVSDTALQAAILHVYRLDPRVVHYHPRVSVRDGIVALQGYVGTSLAKMAAEEVAREFHGVKEVKNRLEVRAYKQERLE